MLAAGLLVHALRATRQRGLGRSALAAGAAALRLLQPDDCGPGASILRGSGLSFQAAAKLASCGSCCFSSSALSSSSRSSRSSSSTTTTTSGSSSPAKGKPGPKTHAAEPQPQLQAWLQQEQGLSAKTADQHARRLALVFGSQQAALDSLPATFEWCRSRGLTGLQTAQLLDHIAKKRRENVVQFASLVQPVWQLLDSYIAAWAEQQRQVGDSKLRKHTSLAEVLCSSKEAAEALVMPPGHVEAWLTAVGEQFPDATIGRLLLSQPLAVTGSPATALAAISWATDVLGCTDPAAFLAKAPSLLTCEASALQRNLDSLQQALGWTAEQTRQLVVKQPAVLTSSSATVQAALAWLRQLFPDAKQLAGIIDRGPHLLFRSAQHLQGNADYLRQALGWQDGDGQLAAFVAAYPQPFAAVDLSSVETQHKLRLLSEVVGISTEQCLTSGFSYLNRRLENIAARYMLVQERAPALLRNKEGELRLSWILTTNHAHNLRRLGMTRDEFNAFVRGWPASEQGRRLLGGLRSGSVEGWPRPPSAREEAQQRGSGAGAAGSGRHGWQAAAAAAAGASEQGIAGQTSSGNFEQRLF